MIDLEELKRKALAEKENSRIQDSFCAKRCYTKMLNKAPAAPQVE
jgi:hypothetical protein